MLASHTLFIFAFVFYFASFVLHLLALLKNRQEWQTNARRGVWIGFLIHFAGVLKLAWESGSFLLNHPSETYAFLSFMIVLFYLLISLRYRVTLLALFTLPLVQFLMLASHLATEGGASRDLLMGYWLNLHVVLTLIAYGAFALACVSGLGYLIQDRQYPCSLY